MDATEPTQTAAPRSDRLSRDPLLPVMSFGLGATRSGMVVGLLAGTISHAAFAGRALASPVEMHRWAASAREEIHSFLWATYDIELPPNVEKPPEPEKPQTPPESEPKQLPTVAEPAAANTPPPPPPPAAQAGQILTAPSDPNEPVDLTGEGFVTGEADSYVGGVTAAAGTSTSPVYDPAAAPTGKPGGTGSAGATTRLPPPPTVDRSRPASVTPAANWSACPFPPEADVDQVDYAVVVIVVTVRPDGSPRSVRVVSDPGHGFGRAARMCALSQRYVPSLDASGAATLGATPPIRVTFTR